MKPQVLLVVTCGLFVVMAYFAFEVMLFRLSCALARLPRPSVPRSVGIVFAVALAVSVAEGLLGVGVTEAYQAGGYPLWEAGLVGFFLGLPLHMLVCAYIHSRMAGIRFDDGIAVWMIEKSIKFGVLLVGGAVAGLIFLIGRG
jgi:hypothetical protein